MTTDPLKPLTDPQAPTPLSAEPPNGNGPAAPQQLAPPAPPSDSPPPLNLRLHVLFHELEPRLLKEFVRHFQHELLAEHPDLPQPSAGTAAFVDAVYPIITEPKKLFPRLYDALLAIQALAATPNRQLLLGLLAQSGIPAPPTALPEHLALEYWLRCPFPSDQLEPLRAQLPAQFLNLPPANANGQNGESTLNSALPTLQLNPPGDLAAIARFPRYKISHLPPDVRLSINQMLRQRIPYAQIIVKLGDYGKGLNKSNLSRWKKTGYLIWLAEQQSREDAQAQLQLLFDLVRENENGKIHQATQQIAALRISQVLARFDPDTLSQALQQHPQAFVRLVQTLPSLSRGGMDCERLLVELAERKASVQNEGDPDKKRVPTERELQYILQKIKLI